MAGEVQTGNSSIDEHLMRLLELNPDCSEAFSGDIVYVRDPDGSIRRQPAEDGR